MGMEGQSRMHFSQGIQGDSYGAHGNAGRTSEEGRNISIEALRRQLECRACDKGIRGVQPGPMMREIRRLKKMLDELGLQLSSEYIIRCKQIRRLTVTSFLT
jgi:hypothetical protein